MVHCLTLCRPGMPDRSITVPPAGLIQHFQIGRDPDCDLSLSEGWVSRKHCFIGFEAGEFFIEDQSSLEGTTLNGQRISVGSCLKTGTVFQSVGWTCGSAGRQRMSRPRPCRVRPRRP